MKTYQLLLVFLFLPAYFFAQVEWAPIGAEWNHSRISDGISPLPITNINIKSVSDTLVAGIETKRLIQTLTFPNGSQIFSEYFTYSENNKVYFQEAESSNGFQLIYNFNLEAEDTLNVYFHESDTLHSFIIDSVSTIMIDNQERSVWHIEDNCYDYGPEIIEGIGSMEGLIPGVCFVTGEVPSISFNCYSDSIISYELESDCEFWGFVSSTTDLTTIPFDIYPNPVQDQLYIDLFHHSSEQYSYRLYNNLGALALEGNLSNSSINVEQLPSGIYYLEIYGANSRSIKAVVIER